MWPILLALVPAFGWGFQGIVMQKVGGTTANKQMGMVLTTLVFGIVVLIFHPISWSWTLIIAAAINGIPWSIAQILQIKSFDYLGVARAMPLATGMQLVITSLLGALFFHEWVHGWQFALGLPALAIIIIGVACTAFQEKSEDAGPTNLKLGIIITFISALLYTSYAAAGKFFSVSSWDMLFPQAVFMFLGTTVIAFCMSGKQSMDPEIGVFGKKSWLNMSTGVLFATANLTVMLSNEINGLAVGWTLSQMNVIVATLGGLFILKEKKTKKEMVFVIIGMVLIAIGGVLIGITKN
ncbi:glucose uptake protein [Bifidobacterium goeldii]|uniref:Glucose uptake protein n=1 Tax=Bifidobacterium goeldii TaxID=2306975 RepID=A0A430FG37_9BIFI|nr:GRP family sugar transporter [Bifidobacterium goeldii]RSX51732.1 glucose uptake protein [Bifidobacterium goeldii]